MAGLTRIISTSTIRPASGDRHPDFNTRVELTPSDVQFLLFPYSQRGLLFHKFQGFNNDVSPVEHLKATLSQALDRLYPLAGRLVATQHDGDVENPSFSIACSGAGVMFVHADAVDTFSVADVLDPDVYPAKLRTELFPMAQALSHQAAGSDVPLLAVQVTDLADGVFLAVSLNHCAADGKTLWDFLNVWSELSRGDEVAISRRSDFHYARQSLDFPVRVPFCPNTVTEALLPPVQPLQCRMLHFSKEKITELKAKANAAEVKTCSGYREISSLQALMAHLWVCITRSQGLNDSNEVAYVMPVGLRERLQPPLPKYYVGTAVRAITVTCTAGELLEHGMGWAARQINKAIADQTSEEAAKIFDSVKNCPPPLSFTGMPPNMLISGNSQHFDVYGNDFGWGKPVAVRSTPRTEGSMMVFQGAIKGSVDFEAIFSPETFRALASDPEFTHYSPY